MSKKKKEPVVYLGFTNLSDDPITTKSATNVRKGYTAFVPKDEAERLAVIFPGTVELLDQEWCDQAFAEGTFKPGYVYNSLTGVEPGAPEGESLETPAGDESGEPETTPDPQTPQELDPQTPQDPEQSTQEPASDPQQPQEPAQDPSSEPAQEPVQEPASDAGSDSAGDSAGDATSTPKGKGK